MSGIGQAQEGVRRFGQELDKSAKKRQAFDDIATKLGLVGAAATAASAFMGKAAMDWEAAWAGVTKTVDGTDAQMAELEEGLRGLARELPATHQEIAAVAEAAGQLGVARGDIVAFTRTMINLGETTNLTADEAATSIAQLMNVMQTAPEDVDNLGSALVALGNDGASTERDIIQMAQNLAGAGATVGLAESEVLALANALASVGIEAEAGGSSVSKILIDMAKAAKTGSADLQVWARTSGMAVDEFQRLVETDPARAFDAFTKGLGRINDAGGDVFTLLEDLGQSDVRVTRALLGMANAGDLLSDSLELGASSWEKNTALVEEAAKRYDTTAAQVQVAWNNIKDNAIDAGAAILPVISSVSEVVVGLSEAFGSLPGPVKSGLGIVVGSAGAMALTAAGFMKAHTAVMDTSRAFKELGFAAPTASGGLGRVGRAAGIATTALIGLQMAAALRPEAEFASTAKYAEAFLDISEGAKGAKASLDELFTVTDGGAFLDGIDSAFKALDMNGFEEGADRVSRALLARKTNAELAEAAFQRADQALTSFVQSGATEQAAAGYEYAADRAERLGYSTAEIAALFPEYMAALQDVDNESRLAASGTEALAGATTMLTEEQQAAQDAARATAEGFMAFSASLDDSKVSLSDWINEMAAQAKSLREFTQNAQTAARRGLDEGLIASLEAAGPAGARRMEQLASASDRELSRANRAWRNGEAAIDDYVNATGKVPKKKSTDVSTPGADKALGSIRAIERALNGMDTYKRITIETHRVNTGNNKGGSGRQTINNADGGVWDFFANGGVRENHVAQIAPAGAWRVWAEPETGGEAYIPLHPSKRSRSIDIWAETGRRLGMQGFADGGFSGELTASMPRSVADSIERGVERGVERAMARIRMDVGRGEATFRNMTRTS